MTKIIVATTNSSKVERMKRLFKNTDYEIVSIKEYGSNIPEPEETAETPEGIAMQKLTHYAKYLPANTLILSQDDTIKLENIREEDDPKMHIKKPVIEKYGEFTAQNAAKYYSELAHKYGGTIPITFNYGNALGIKKEGERTITKVLGTTSKLSARVVDSIHNLERNMTYFFDSILEENINGEWKRSNELTEDELIELDKDLYSAIQTLLENI